MNRRTARAHACYMVAAWSEDVLKAGALSEQSERLGWSDEDHSKVEAEIGAVTSRLFDRWIAGGAPSSFPDADANPQEDDGVKS